MGNSKLYQLCTCAETISDHENPCSWAISEDFRVFQQQKWYRLQYKRLFDPNKFIFLYNDYKNIEEKLIELWEIFDMSILKNIHPPKHQYSVISEQLKYAIRRGVPVSLYKAVIEGIFYFAYHNNHETEYLTKIQVLKKKKKSQLSISKTSHLFLNTEGVKALQRIRLLLYQTEGQLKFNPYLQNFLALLQIFQKEEIIFYITSKLIQHSFNISIQRQQSLRWHFTLNQHQFEKLATKFYDVVEQISPTIYSIGQYLQKVHIRKVQVFSEIVGHFFIGYLPFQIVLRIFMEFLNEGVRVFYRVFYSILKLSTESILEGQSFKQIMRAIKSKLLVFFNCEDNIRVFFRYAFDLCLDPLYFSKLKQLEMEQNQVTKRIYYLPVISGTSQILNRYQFEYLWEYIPLLIKYYNLKLIFRKKLGSNINQMISSLMLHNYTIILIQTDKHAVLGVLLAQKLPNRKKIKHIVEHKFRTIRSLSSPCIEEPLAIDKKRHALLKQSETMQQMLYFGSSQSFVFTIKPELAKYHSTGQNKHLQLEDLRSILLSSSTKLQLQGQAKDLEHITTGLYMKIRENILKFNIQSVTVYSEALL